MELTNENRPPKLLPFLLLRRNRVKGRKRQTFLWFLSDKHKAVKYLTGFTFKCSPYVQLYKHVTNINSVINSNNENVYIYFTVLQMHEDSRVKAKIYLNILVSITYHSIFSQFLFLPTKILEMHLNFS